MTVLQQPILNLIFLSSNPIKMKKQGFYTLFLMLGFVICNAQNIYFKNLTDSIINKFNTDTNRISIKETDPLYKYKNYFNYVMCFYPKLEYQKIIISSGPSHKVANVKIKALDAIAGSEDRVYSIKFSSKTHSLIDTVIFEHLTIDSRVALISIQISMVQYYSTCVFFDVIDTYFKKNSIKRSKELNKDVNLKTIEAGQGFQLMDYTNEVLDKLLEDNWKDKKAYKKHYRKNTHALMSYDEIRTYMYDYPVYLQNIYK